MRDTNLAHAVDVWLFGPHGYKSYADPEGLLSTLPAIATTLVGVLAGRMLRREDPPAGTIGPVMTGGVALVVIGVLLEWWAMPINKQLWTPSYVAFTAGLACLDAGRDVLSGRCPRPAAPGGSAGGDGKRMRFSSFCSLGFSDVCSR